MFLLSFNASSSVLLLSSISLLLLSFLSLLLILYLRLNSRRRHHLSTFTPLSPLRLTLITLIVIWALNETILRLPLFPQSENSYTLQIVLSLGILEPGFLTALIYLVHLSIQNPNKIVRAILVIPLAVIPTAALQITLLSFEESLPEFFRYKVENNCSHPLFSTIVFTLFAIPYCIAFVVTYRRVITLVINKGTRLRIHALAFAILVCISLQVSLLLALSLRRHNDATCGFIGVGMFVSVAVCAAVAECVLVIKPIIDALSAAAAQQRPAVEEGGK